MINHSTDKVNAKLAELQVEDLADKTDFYIRKPRKITATNFLLSFIEMTLSGCFSLRIWATFLTLLIKDTVSFQAISKKLYYRHLAFLSALLQKLCLQSFQQTRHLNTQELFAPFNRVLLEDSSCFKLCKALLAAFPGPSSSGAKTWACGRIQFRFDLKNHCFNSVHLTHYRNNDASYAASILDILKKGDLIIRDLGYFKIDVFKKIAKLGAFFVSRLKINICIFDVETKKQIELFTFLKKLEAKGITQVDQVFLIGTVQQYKVRLVAFKLNEQNTEKRIRAAQKARTSTKRNLSPKTRYLLSWNFFITNVEAETWTAKEVYHAYTLRWHIEMIFKNWKSNFKLPQLMNTCKSPNPIRPELLLLLFLIMMMLLVNPKFLDYQMVILQRTGKILSPMRFALFIKLLARVEKSVSEELILKILAQNFCYDKRKDRLNHYEKTYNLNLS